MKVRVVGRGVMKVVGGRTPPEREVGRSVSATPIFFAALRAAVRVGRPDRIGNAALGQRRLETL